MMSAGTMLIKISTPITVFPILLDSGNPWIKALADWRFLKTYDFA